jgi:hypothetical protein
MVGATMGQLLSRCTVSGVVTRNTSDPADRRLRHCWSTNLTTTLCLQVQKLPKDRWHPQFLPRLEELSQALGSVGDSDDMPLPEDVLDLQLIRTLLELLPAPCPVLPSSESALAQLVQDESAVQTSGVQSTHGGATQHRGAGFASCRTIVSQVTVLMTNIALQQQALAGKQAARPGDNLLLEAIEQLLSSTEVARAALQCGLSAETQEAARAGDTAAADCMAAVATMFRVAAYLVPFTASSGCRSEAAYQKLTAVLVLEESLPYLEPLCLSLDPYSKFWICIGKPAALLQAFNCFLPSLSGSGRVQGCD